MESPVPAPAPAAGPCVYVPISHPDSPAPTYAVLQVLGISPAPDPALLGLPPATIPCSSSPVPAPRRCPPSSADSAHSSSSSDDKEKEKEKERIFPSVRPAPMKKSAAPAAPRRSPKAPPPPFKPTISITHTDKDRIILAAPSEFRKVVHELTGAASGDRGLLPITAAPSRANRSCADRDSVSLPPCAGGKENGGSGGGAIAESGCDRQPTVRYSANLLERRKSDKVLGRLKTSCRGSSALVPSPVTPLASDFEKITPSSSEGSLTPGRLSSLASPMSRGVKALETLSLSGAMASHAEGSAQVLSRSHSVKEPSVHVKLSSLDAMDMQPHEVPRLLHSRSVNLHHRDDAQLATSHGTQSTKSSSLHTQMDYEQTGPDVLRLALAPAGTGDLSIPNAADVQHAEESCANEHEDAMEIETLSGSQDATPVLIESCSASDEGSIVAQKGFFFHAERPAHADLTLLSLFPESSRNL